MYQEKGETITVEWGELIPTLPYANKTVRASYTTTVRDKETIEQAYKRAWAVVQSQVQMYHTLILTSIKDV